MDVTFSSAVRLAEQGCSIKSISRRLGISEYKTKKIVLTAGLCSTPRTAEIAALQRAGSSVGEIAARLGITSNAVSANLPYSKGPYGAEYPSRNALSIRRSRGKKEAR